MARRRRHASFTKAAELSLVAPQVIAMRTARMLAAGANPSARDRREFQRMGSEKVLAFWESMSAMGVEAFKANASLWGILEKGLAPVHKRAKANARRLRR